MQRVTITLDDDLIADIDAFMASHGYGNRSEAIRDLTRTGMGEVHAETEQSGTCVAALVYMFDHERRDLARRLTRAHHRHHDLSLAATHVHLDDSNCLEVVLLRGEVGAVKHLADHVMAERGVRHGRLVVVPVETGTAGSGETNGSKRRLRTRSKS
jgi:CopG family transcriptional regulator, nickel-responsive regulator